MRKWDQVHKLGGMWVRWHGKFNAAVGREIVLRKVSQQPLRFARSTLEVVPPDKTHFVRIRKV